MARLKSLPPLVSGFAPATRVEQNRQADARRGPASQRGYDSAWAKASRAFREANPLCEYCALQERVGPAQLTDHLYPVHRYEGVFWVKHWWVASCTPCHSGFKQGVEHQGKPALDALAARLGRPLHP